MNRRFFSLSLFVGLLTQTMSCHASIDLTGIIFKLGELYGVNATNLPYLKDMNNRTLQQLQAFTGKHSFGQINYQDFQSWGQAAQQWDSLLTGYQNGQGEIGNLQKRLNNQFPIKPNYATFHQQTMQSDFEKLQAQTALASRAASQAVFDRIQKQIDYQKTLQTQIDQTTDMKSAVDLQNRLLFESNLIALDTLRLIAMSTQQKAIGLQADVNSAVMNKAFISELK